MVQLVRRREIPSVAGNHELGLAQAEYMDWFNVLAQKSLKITQRRMTAESLEYCRNLPLFRHVGECLLVHGCPPDSAMIYLFEPSDFQLKRIFEELDRPVCFVGHTHMLQIFSYDGSGIEKSDLGQGVTALAASHRHIVNVGSVGQPRDGNNQAKYVIWDTARRTLEVRFVPYDIAVTVQKLISNGWPELHARRLW